MSKGNSTQRRWMVPMRGRSPLEPHRTATPLELLFDLVFVVAIAQAAHGLEEEISAGNFAEAGPAYLGVFFAIWWAWMNFSWFASAYDTDDVPYRLNVFVQLTGALILAAGVPQFLHEESFGTVTLGFVVIRLALVAHWLRAARTDERHRPTALRYALGISILQVGWVISFTFLPTALNLPGFLTLATGELLVPIWAERPAPTPWHPGHIAERYGLFTIIVLGESILAASLAIRSAADAGRVTADLVAVAAGGILIVLAMWWLYFERPEEPAPRVPRRMFTWGYGHYTLWAAAAAVGAGLALNAERATGHGEIGTVGAGMAVAIPVAIYVLGLWSLDSARRAEGPRAAVEAITTSLLILATPFSGHAALLTGLVLAALLTLRLIRRR